MKTAKIVLNFLRCGDSILETKAFHILSCMTGNVNFKTPTPSIEELNTAIQNYSTALSGAKTRDKVKISAKNDMRSALRFVLSSLAGYVTYTANGDRTILVSSGFSVTAETTASRTLAAPNNFTVEQGTHPGEVNISVEPVSGADNYVFLYAQAPVVNNAWQVQIRSNPYFTITGLESMTQYSFRIGIGGSNNQSVYTSVITKGVV